MIVPHIDIDSKQCYINIHSGNGQPYHCYIGENGYAQDGLGREGDKKTPLGHYTLRFGLFRGDRVSPPQSSLTFWPLKPSDGWCDAPSDPAYNRFIALPYPASHEKLWRQDGVYDIILVISHNDSPPQRDENGIGFGSAVFIHIAQPDGRPTLGCIAVTPDVMTRLLPSLYTGMDVLIHDGTQ